MISKMFQPESCESQQHEMKPEETLPQILPDETTNTVNCYSLASLNAIKLPFNTPIKPLSVRNVSKDLPNVSRTTVYLNHSQPELTLSDFDLPSNWSDNARDKTNQEDENESQSIMFEELPELRRIAGEIVASPLFSQTGSPLGFYKHLALQKFEQGQKTDNEMAGNSGNPNADQDLDVVENLPSSLSCNQALLDHEQLYPIKVYSGSKENLCGDNLSLPTSTPFASDEEEDKQQQPSAPLDHTRSYSSVSRVSQKSYNLSALYERQDPHDSSLPKDIVSIHSKAHAEAINFVIDGSDSRTLSRNLTSTTSCSPGAVITTTTIIHSRPLPPLPPVPAYLNEYSICNFDDIYQQKLKNLPVLGSDYQTHNQSGSSIGSGEPGLLNNSFQSLNLESEKKYTQVLQRSQTFSGAGALFFQHSSNTIKSEPSNLTRANWHRSSTPIKLEYSDHISSDICVNSRKFSFTKSIIENNVQDFSKISRNSGSRKSTLSSIGPSSQCFRTGDTSFGSIYDLDYNNSEFSFEPTNDRYLYVTNGDASEPRLSDVKGDTENHEMPKIYSEKLYEHHDSSVLNETPASVKNKISVSQGPLEKPLPLLPINEKNPDHSKDNEQNSSIRSVLSETSSEYDSEEIVSPTMIRLMEFFDSNQTGELPLQSDALCEDKIMPENFGQPLCIQNNEFSNPQSPMPLNPYKSMIIDSSMPTTDPTPTTTADRRDSRHLGSTEEYPRIPASVYLTHVPSIYSRYIPHPSLPPSQLSVRTLNSSKTGSDSLNSFPLHQQQSLFSSSESAITSSSSPPPQLLAYEMFEENSPEKGKLRLPLLGSNSRLSFKPSALIGKDKILQQADHKDKEDKNKRLYLQYQRQVRNQQKERISVNYLQADSSKPTSDSTSQQPHKPVYVHHTHHLHFSEYPALKPVAEKCATSYNKSTNKLKTLNRPYENSIASPSAKTSTAEIKGKKEANVLRRLKQKIGKT